MRLEAYDLDLEDDDECFGDGGCCNSAHTRTAISANAHSLWGQNDDRMIDIVVGVEGESRYEIILTEDDVFELVSSYFGVGRRKDR